VETEEAVERAIQFLEKKAGYYTHKLISVKFDESTKVWSLQFDVGLFGEQRVNITIEDETGKVLSYERPK